MHKLTISAVNRGTILQLDDFELQAVTGYELKSITPQISELVLRLNVSNTKMLDTNDTSIIRKIASGELGCDLDDITVFRE